MSIIRRLKRLWELSGESVEPPNLLVADSAVPTVSDGSGVVITEVPIGLATIVEDDPLDIFPSETAEGEVVEPKHD